MPVLALAAAREQNSFRHRGILNKPGVYEIELGVPVEDFIYADEWCGGIRPGHKFKALVAGGSSVPILPAPLALMLANGDKRLMSYESLSDGGFLTGTMLGSGGFIVFDETSCVVRNTWNFLAFLPPRILRTVQPLPRGNRLDGESAAPDRIRAWASAGH